MDEWSDDTYSNGIFLLCVNGILFPERIFTATLGIEIECLKRNLLDIPIDEELFNEEKEEAFLTIYNITFPLWSDDDSIENDYQYYISPIEIADYGCIIFAVNNGEQIRIMATNLNKLSYDKEKSTYDFSNVDISETFITQEEMKEMILELEQVLVNLI